MTARGKKWLMFILAAVALIALYQVVNLAIFTAWQTAFTNANVSALTWWFYLYCGIAIALLIAAILFVRQGFKIEVTD